MIESILIKILITIGILSIFPIIWLISSKTYSEKGFFGYHACRWLNSTCLRNGIMIDSGRFCVDGTPRRYCKNHYEESQYIRRLVDRQYKGEITQDAFWELRKLN